MHKNFVKHLVTDRQKRIAKKRAESYYGKTINAREEETCLLGVVRLRSK